MRAYSPATAWGLVFGAALLAGASLPSRADGGRAAVLKGGLPAEDAALADAVAREVAAAGYDVTELDADGVCDPKRLDAKGLDLLVLPNAGTLPAGAARPIEAYLRGGGDLIALRAPLWRRALLRIDGQWRTREEYQREHAGAPIEHTLFDYDPDEMKRWQRSSNRPESAAVYEAVPDGPGPGQRALHVTLTNLAGWDTFVAAAAGAFPPGHTLTVFSAKGGGRTTQLAIEWVEKDGSRWIAVVHLAPEWRRYVLAPGDFQYWQSNPHRGHKGDRFKPENAAEIHVGLAFSHTGHVGGRHEYRVGPLGTARPTPETEQLATAFAPPVLEALTPGYKYFDAHDVQTLLVRTDQAILDATGFAVPARIRSPHPRASGAGFDKGRAWRWCPLIEARSGSGEWRGTPAVLLVHADGPFQGGAWASFGVDDEDWYRQPAVLRSIGRIARRMRQGPFFLDAGANHYTCFEHQEVRLGARMTAPSPRRAQRAPDGLRVRITVTDAATGTEVMRREWPPAFANDRAGTVSASWTPDRRPADGFRITAELADGDDVLDRVRHEIHVWRPNETKRFVTIRDGHFALDGKRWRAHGVNYMPSSGIGMEDWPCFEHWVGAASYDPEVIERDLRHVRDLGLNAVSIFVDQVSVPAQNFLDLLRLLDRYGLKANVSLRPGTPLHFDHQWPRIREIIDYYRLPERDTIFAYDLAWEPMFGTHEDRTPWDRDWEGWIVERYGSIENAEKDWAFRVPRTPAGAVTNPLPGQIDTDGDWRRMTAAYRRFLDTLLYRKYGRARRVVRAVAPNQSVSFRMAEAGNPDYRWGGRIPYDFPYLAAAVDFLAPEAYGRIGDWEKVRPGWFETQYARWAAPGKPVVWAEMGCSTWEMSRMETSRELLDFQAMFYTQFYRLLIGSGADGVFYWWYPGGYRWGENSDFGIMNPDGTDRPVSKVIRDHARAYLDGPDARAVDHWIEFDRDRHPDGIAGIYDAAKDEFWKAIDAGRTPGLRTAGTGTTSRDCPLLAVGNTPCNGTNPPKYLDGAFDLVEVQDADGQWTAVEPGGRVRARADKPVVARVTATNLGEAAWEPPPGGSSPPTPAPAGSVYIVAAVRAAERRSDETTEGKKIRNTGATDRTNSTRTAIPTPVPRHASVQLPEVALAPAGPSGDVAITLTFTAEGRTPFGERFELTITR